MIDLQRRLDGRYRDDPACIELEGKKKRWSPRSYRFSLFDVIMTEIMNFNLSDYYETPNGGGRAPLLSPSTLSSVFVLLENRGLKINTLKGSKSSFLVFDQI